MTELYSKTDIITALEGKYAQLIHWLEQHDDHRFEVAPIEGKWSCGQHVEHLILSTKPLRTAMKMPYVMLGQLFGKKNERPERSYEEVVAKYRLKLSQGGRAPSEYEPKQVENNQKAALLAQLQRELDQLCSIIETWKEDKMSIYLLPHPLIGKMTIREILLFTIYHTEHHTNALRNGY
ncbi:MAG: DinB family protein [Bacteroidota bacterium]